MVRPRPHNPSRKVYFYWNIRYFDKALHPHTDIWRKRLSSPKKGIQFSACLLVSKTSTNTTRMFTQRLHISTDCLYGNRKRPQIIVLFLRTVKMEYDPSSSELSSISQLSIEIHSAGPLQDNPILRLVKTGVINAIWWLSARDRDGSGRRSLSTSVIVLDLEKKLSRPLFCRPISKRVVFTVRRVRWLNPDAGCWLDFICNT